MKRILKYELEIKNNQTIKIPSDRILSIEEQNGKIVAYALTDITIVPIEYEFEINGTGNPIDFNVDNFEFLGTVRLYNGSLMFHVFYKNKGES